MEKLIEDLKNQVHEESTNRKLAEQRVDSYKNLLEESRKIKVPEQTKNEHVKKL